MMSHEQSIKSGYSLLVQMIMIISCIDLPAFEFDHLNSSDFVWFVRFPVENMKRSSQFKADSFSTGL